MSTRPRTASTRHYRKRPTYAEAIKARKCTCCYHADAAPKRTKCKSCLDASAKRSNIAYHKRMKAKLPKPIHGFTVTRWFVASQMPCFTRSA